MRLRQLVPNGFQNGLDKQPPRSKSDDGPSLAGDHGRGRGLRGGGTGHPIGGLGWVRRSATPVHSTRSSSPFPAPLSWDFAYRNFAPAAVRADGGKRPTHNISRSNDTSAKKCV